MTSHPCARPPQNLRSCQVVGYLDKGLKIHNFLLLAVLSNQHRNKATDFQASHCHSGPSRKVGLRRVGLHVVAVWMKVLSLLKDCQNWRGSFPIYISTASTSKPWLVSEAFHIDACRRDWYFHTCYKLLLCHTNCYLFKKKMQKVSPILQDLVYNNLF